MHSFIKITSCALLLTSCFESAVISNASRVGASADKSSALYADADKVSTEVDASSTTAVNVTAPNSGNLQGTSVVISPGTLGISSAIILETGVSLGETSVVNEVNLAADIQIQSASTAVIIRPSAQVELRSPLAISLPLPVSSNLALASGVYAVYFKYLDPSSGKLMTGLITVDGGSASTRFDSASSKDVIDFKGYFGSYWVVQLSRSVLVSEIPAIKETKEAIVNKSSTAVITTTGVLAESAIVTNQAIAKVELGTPSLVFEPTTRTIVLKIASDAKIKSCVVDVFAKLSDLSGVTVDVAASFYYSAVIEKTTARAVVGRFRCTDIYDRKVVSAWSGIVTVPAEKSDAPTANSVVAVNVDRSSAYIVWEAASSGIESSALDYKVVYSLNASLINTVAKVDAINTAAEGLARDWSGNLAATVVGLQGLKTYHFAILVRNAQGAKALYPLTSGNTAGTIFLSETYVDGTLNASGRDRPETPVGRADYICNNDFLKPADGAIYKAMISVPEVRRACTSANCTANGMLEQLDWVFKPNRSYYSINNQLVTTTNERALMGSVTDDDLVNPGSNGVQFAWTGMMVDYTIHGSNCQNWTSRSSSVYGSTGVVGANSNHLIGEGNASCSSLINLVCVQQ